jgi:hypothetical protein
LLGDLELRGITHPIEASGTYRPPVADPYRDPGLNARTAGVYLRADPSDLEVLEGGNPQ